MQTAKLPPILIVSKYEMDFRIRLYRCKIKKKLRGPKFLRAVNGDRTHDPQLGIPGARDYLLSYYHHCNPVRVPFPKIQPADLV
jgi:hypothetical protein